MEDRTAEQVGKLDERLTEARGEVTEFRKEIKEDFVELRKEMASGFAELRSSFDRRLEPVEERIYRLNYTLIAGAIAIIVALIGFRG